MREIRNSLAIPMALAFCLAAGGAFAQTTTGTITVIVTDAEDAALPGATVTAETPDSVVKRSAVTDEKGEARLLALDPSPRYVVTTTLEGFNGSRNENVLVTSGLTTTLRVQLQLSSVTEEITVTGETPLVDATTAIIGQDITLELAEALPIARSYQGHLQLVPGVAPDLRGTGPSGNPAARSGMNWADIDGEIGQSRDNFYYLEGINVTDGVTGTFGANMNSEVIQEQKVLTGGIPAEFVGAPGLVSSVITKSGGNGFLGSVNYFTEDDSLRADNKHSPEAGFERQDIAGTIGGPIVRDRAWFFGSYRDIDRDEDITTLDTGVFLRTVNRKDEQYFGKVSWAISQNQNLAGTFMGDPTEISGSTSRTVVANRDTATDQGGDRYIANYTGIFGPSLVSLAAGEHNGEVSTFAAVRDPLNTIIFRRADAAPLVQQQLGGAGQDTIDERDTEFYNGSLELAFATGEFDHQLKFGLDYQEHVNFRNIVFTGDQYRGSLSPSLAGLTAAQVSALASAGQLTNSFFNVNNTSDFNGFITSVNASPNRASFYGAFDTDHNGVITQAELGAALRFNSTAGNPNGFVNYDRITQAALGPQHTQSEGKTIFLQDEIRISNWTFNLGLRAEEWVHVATTGADIFTFDWEYAPRVSAAWDVRGDGKQRVSAFYGRYYDPIRNNLTNFAGTLSGTVRHEQVFANGEWVTYRVRGGPVVLDATFSPTTETPYTDEILLTYALDLGRNMAFEVNAYHRETKDVIEDYDLCLYSGDCYPGDPNAAGALFLPPSYFGYPQGFPSGINFFIATLAGGERELDGAELVFRKRLANNWQGIASYTYGDSTGNTNSDSNADFAGDILEMDPRAPNASGKLPGSIDHIVKLYGSYHFDFGLALGAGYRWNSGAYQTRSYLAFRRHLPVTGPAFDFGGIPDYNWNAADSVGGIENPDYGVLDLSATYDHDFGVFGAKIFVSVSNALDDQAAIRTQDLSAGQGGVAFGQPTEWVPPRTIGLGVRFSFGD